jgi:hypothetical protein
LLLRGACCFPGRVFPAGAVGVYQVCSLIACPTGLVVVDEVVRRDRLLGDPEVPPFPALRGLGRVLEGQQVVPAQGAPCILLGQQAQGVGIEGGLTLRRRCAQYRVRSGSSGDALPLTRVCRTMSVQAGFGR